MSLPKLPPELRGFVESTKRRLTEVEKRLNSALDALRDRDTFDLQGQIYVSESGDLPMGSAKRAVTLKITIKVPGETATTVQLKRSGTVVQEVEVGAGVTNVEVGISVAYDVTDVVAVAVSAAGLNAQSLVVVVYWR